MLRTVLDAANPRPASRVQQRPGMSTAQTTLACCQQSHPEVVVGSRDFFSLPPPILLVQPPPVYSPPHPYLHQLFSFLTFFFYLIVSVMTSGLDSMGKPQAVIVLYVCF